MDREWFRSLEKEYTEEESREEEIHRNTSDEDRNLLPPLYHRKCISITALWIRKILSFETDKTTERNPIKCPISSLRISKYTNKPRRNTDTEFVHFHPAPSCDHEMTELVKENNEKKDTQCENDSDKDSHKIE